MQTLLLQKSYKPPPSKVDNKNWDKGKKASNQAKLCDNSRAKEAITQANCYEGIMDGQDILHIEADKDYGYDYSCIHSQNNRKKTGNHHWHGGYTASKNQMKKHGS